MASVPSGHASRFGCFGSSFSVLAEASPQASPQMRAAASPFFAPTSPTALGTVHGFVLTPTMQAAAASPVLVAQVPPCPTTRSPAAAPTLQPLQQRTVTAPLLTQRRSSTGDIGAVAASPAAVPPSGGALAACPSVMQQHRLRAQTDPPAQFARAVTEPSLSTSKEATESEVANATGVAKLPVGTALQQNPSFRAQAPAPLTLPQPRPQPVVVTYVTRPTLVLPVQHTAMAPSSAVARCQSPVLVRQLSGGSPPGSPKWTVVQQPQRRASRSGVKSATKATGGVAGSCTMMAPAGEMVAPQHARDVDRDSVDLAYEQKEFFLRSGRRETKQSWNAKAQRKTDYQVVKRRDQASQQRARNQGMEDDDCDY